MWWPPKLVVLVAVFWAVLVGTGGLAGCSPVPPEPGGPEEGHSRHKAEHHHKGSGSRAHHDTRPGEAPGALAEKARTVLSYVDEHNEAPMGYEGGRAFHNAGGPGEQALPKHDGQGRAITYREWDVNPHRGGTDRGPERLVTGSDGSAYVTADHYKTFTKLR